MSRLTRALRTLFHVRPKGPDRALEERLLARYDAVHPEAPRRLPMRLSSRIAVTACATLAFGLIAFRAPAQVQVSLGRSVAVTVPAGEPAPDHEALRGFFDRLCSRDEGGRAEIGIRMKRNADGPTTLHFDVWCEGLPRSIADRLRAELPALASAEISETPLEGRVETSLGRKLGHRLLGLDVDLDRADEEALRREILESLGAGVDPAHVDIDIRGEGEARTVRVKVSETKADLRLRLHLRTGESRTLPLDFDVAREALAVPGVIEVAIDPDAKTITLTGVAPGTTTLLLEDAAKAHRRAYEITVER